MGLTDLGKPIVTMSVAPLAATVPGTAGASAYTLSRLLGTGSTLSLITGTNSNLTLSGLNIVPTAAIGQTPQTAEVRETLGQVAIEYPVTLSIVTAPLVIAMAGSSSPQQYADTFTGGPVTANVRQSNNGTTFATMAAGRYCMEAGAIIVAATGRGVDFLRAGAGGSTLQDWEAAATGSGVRATLVNQINAAGRCDYVNLQVGSNDVDTGLVLSTVALQAARIRSLISKIRSETSMPNLKFVINTTQDRASSNLEPALTIQRHAEMTVALNDANCFFGVNVYDLATSDTVHQTEASQAISGPRFADQIVALILGTPQKRGPLIASTTPISATTTDVVLTHRNGTDFTPTSGVTGFKLTTDTGTNIAITAAVRQSATVVRLTHDARAAGVAGLLDYMPNGGAGDDLTTPRDNATRPLPFEVPVAAIAVAAAPSVIALTGSPPSATQGQAYSYTPATVGGSGTKTWSITGTLPAGLTHNTTTGVISGTPTTAGSYTFTQSVTDTSGTASASRTISVASSGATATGKAAKVNFQSPGAASADTSWNNFQSGTLALKTPAGAASGWSVANGTNSASNGGTTTGNNSGIYPDDVMATYLFLQNGNIVVTLTGLDDTKRYQIDAFASRAGATGRIVDYTVAGVTIAINVGNNTSRIATFNTVAPSGGQIVLTVSPNAGSDQAYSYVGAVVVTEYLP